MRCFHKDSQKLSVIILPHWNVQSVTFLVHFLATNHSKEHGEMKIIRAAMRSTHCLANLFTKYFMFCYIFHLTRAFCVNCMQIFQHFIEFIRLALFTLAFMRSEHAVRTKHQIEMCRMLTLWRAYI